MILQSFLWSASELIKDSNQTNQHIIASVVRKMEPKLVLLLCFSSCLIVSSSNGQFQYVKDMVSSWNPYKYFASKQGPEPLHFMNLNQFQPPPAWPPVNIGPPPPPPAIRVKNTDSNELIRDCKSPSTQGKLFNASITPCEGEGYCTLQRGTNSTLEFDFISNVETKTLFGKLSGIFGWFELSFGKSEDLCSYPGISCPIKPGVTYKVVRVIEVLRSFPALEIDTKVQVYGDEDLEGDIGCVIVPVKIK